MANLSSMSYIFVAHFQIVVTHLTHLPTLLCKHAQCPSCSPINQGSRLCSQLYQEVILTTSFSFLFPLKMASLRSDRRSVPSVNHLFKDTLEREPVFALFKNDCFPLQRVDHLHLSLLFVLLLFSPDRCCDALACPCSESFSSLQAPLFCQAEDHL